LKPRSSHYSIFDSIVVNANPAIVDVGIVDVCKWSFCPFSFVDLTSQMVYILKATNKKPFEDSQQQPQDRIFLRGFRIPNRPTANARQSDQVGQIPPPIKIRVPSTGSSCRASVHRVHEPQA